MIPMVTKVGDLVFVDTISAFDAVRLLKEMGEWLDFGDEGGKWLYQC